MQQIEQALDTIASTNNIEILYACETGSRAWGFPSPDSDYDVRFIYRHPKNWYLNLGTPKDYVESMQGELDITGWDLKKSLHLLKKSNASLIERFQSPIVYAANEAFANDFKQLISAYYSPTAVFYHHYQLAENFWMDIKDASDIKLKSYCYLVRSLLSCNWIVKDSSVLPMHIEGLMELTTGQNTRILRDVIKLKATVGEKYLHKQEDDLRNLITDLFELIDPVKHTLGINDKDYTLLNTFFLQTLNADANY